MTPPTSLPAKKDVARALLLRGSLFVHLDPRSDRVAVPQWLRSQAQLVLQLGLDMPVPIPDLRVDDTGVHATLSFQRSPFACIVPWEAVFALVGDDGRGMVWPDDLPAEIAAEVEHEAVKRGRGQKDRNAIRRAAPSEPSAQRAPVQGDGENTVRALRPGGSGATLALLGHGNRRGNRAATRKPKPLPPYLRVVK